MGTGYFDRVTITIKAEVHDDYSSREEDRTTAFKRELEMVCSRYSQNFDVNMERE